MSAQPHRLSTGLAFITFCYNRYILLHINCYKLVISNAALTTLKALDLTRYTRRVTTNPPIKGFSRMNLSTFLKVKKINKLKINKKNLLFITSLLLITQGNTYANAATSTDYYKLYLHSKIVSEKQYKCAYYVAHIESRWNYKAINGNHYGLFQMKNVKVKYMNAYQQIDLWAKYVSHRYKGNYCLAMSHLKTRNWQ